MNFWFCTGSHVVPGLNGKSSGYFDFNLANQTWLTLDVGAHGWMTSPGLNTSPLGSVGQVFNFHDGGANQAQYQVTGTAVDICYFTLYHGVAIPNGIVIDQTTGPFIGLGFAIDAYTQGDWIWCKSGVDYTTEHAPAPLFVPSNSLGLWNPAHASAVVMTTFCHYKDVPGDAADHPDIMGVDSDYAVNLDAADQGLNYCLSYAAFGTVFNIRFIGFSAFGAVQNGFNCGLMVGNQYINCDAHGNGAYGAYLAASSVVSNFQTSANGSGGMFAGAGSSVSDLRTFNNGDYGFSAGSYYGSISNSLSYGNVGGVRLYGGWIMDRVTVDGNGSYALYVIGARPVVVKNSIIMNSGLFLDLCGAVAQEDYRYLFDTCLFGMYTGAILANNELAIFRNTTDFGAAATFDDFGFVNGAGNDYRLTKRSVALGAGSLAYQSIGYHEPERQKVMSVGQVVD